MDTFKNIGLIECGEPLSQFQLQETSTKKGYTLKKVLVRDNASLRTASRHYPQAEIVQDMNSIIHDNSIDLVVLTTPNAADLELIPEVIKSGKHIRII